MRLPISRTYASRDLLALSLLSITTILNAGSVIGASLYKEGDNILELDIDTFNSTVYGKPHAYFVEFYSSWCGHCIVRTEIHSNGTDSYTWNYRTMPLISSSSPLF